MKAHRKSVEFPPENETAEEKARRRQAWPVRKFKTHEEANENEILEMAAMTPAERVAIVLDLQERLGLQCDGLRKAAKDGKLKVLRKNWPDRR